jgi:ankyrin repeat protein
MKKIMWMLIFISYASLLRADGSRSPLLRQAAQLNLKSLLKSLIESETIEPESDSFPDAKPDILKLIKEGNESEVQNLLRKRKKNATFVDKSTGFTPLHVAAMHGRLDVLDLLFDKGAQKIVNVADRNGNTALHYAVKNGDPKVVMTLLINKADPTIENLKGQKPIDLIQENNQFIKNLLIEYAKKF